MIILRELLEDRFPIEVLSEKHGIHIKGFSKNPLTNGIRAYTAKPYFRKTPIKVFRIALN